MAISVQNKKAKLCKIGGVIYWVNVEVNGIFTLIGHTPFLTFIIILEHFSNLFFKHISAPVSGLSWKTEIYRPEDLRLGALSIHHFLSLMPKNFTRLSTYQTGLIVCMLDNN